MKNINIMFEDNEYELLKKEKGNLSWKEFFLKPYQISIRRKLKNER